MNTYALSLIYRQYDLAHTQYKLSLLNTKQENRPQTTTKTNVPGYL